MSSAGILAELPKLKAEERTQVCERLCELQERDLLDGLGPTAEEKITRAASSTSGREKQFSFTRAALKLP
jgi:hypothetical protein